MKYSLLNRLLLLMFLTLSAVTIVLIYFSNKEVCRIIDLSQNALFEERIDSVVNLLAESNQKLVATGLPDSYRDDFQISALKRLSVMYNSSKFSAVPIIFDQENNLLLENDLTLNLSEKDKKQLLDTIVAQENDGEEYQQFKDDTDWAMFGTFEPWGWRIGFVVSLAERYDDAVKVRNGVSGLMITTITLLLGAGGVAVVRLVRPLLQLKEATEGVEDGVFDRPVDLGLRRNDEIGLLTSGFVKMRDSIKSQVDDLEKMNDLLQREIKERNRSEKEKYESEQNYKNVFNGTSEAIFVHDGVTGEILDVNQSMLSLWGYSKEEVLSLPVSELSADEFGQSQEKAVGYIQKTIEEGPQSFEWLSKKRNGEEFWSEMSLRAYTIMGEVRVLAVGRDITERKDAEKLQKEMENQLQHAQKMEAIGTLAGGIAHDFNNILTPIIGYTEMVMMNMEKGSDEFGEMDIVLNASLKAKDLVQQILTFSRKNEVEKSPIKLQKVVGEAHRLLRSSIPSNIHIASEIDQECPKVIADSSQIIRIILNLCTNSSHALQDDNGSIEISLSHEANYGDKQSEYVCLTISDDGQGIKEENLDRIFEPYFSTKHKTQGTGLGLSIVHGIVKGLGGEIKVASTLGKGTTFFIYFPVVTDEDISTVTLDGQDQMKGGEESIIIIDDEEHVLGFERMMLQQLGYKVNAFSDVREAIQYFSHNIETVDLVITDMTMPHMSGLELSQIVHSEAPKTPIILVSGFSAVIDKDVAHSVGVVEMVNKPLTMEEFATVVRGTIDRFGRVQG